jgi:hypothetical protein
MADQVNPFGDPEFMQLLGASMIGAINPRGQQGNFANPAINAWMQGNQMRQQQLQHEQNLGFRLQGLEAEENARERRFGLQEQELEDQRDYRDRSLEVQERQEDRLSRNADLDRTLTELKVEAARKGLEEQEALTTNLAEAARLVNIDPTVAGNLARSEQGQKTLLKMIRDKARGSGSVKELIDKEIAEMGAFMPGDPEALREKRDNLYRIYGISVGGGEGAGGASGGGGATGAGSSSYWGDRVE